MAVITETTIGVIAIQYSRSSLSGIEFWVLHAEFYDCDIRHQAAALSPELPLLCSLAYLKGSYIFKLETFSDLHVCRELMGIALSKHGEAAKVVSEEQLIAAEMGQRIKLLQEDRFALLSRF
ncbi:uncharacterized protein LOC127744815 isoform X2 [Arachis duranensis]|uniref:Uncharacterized protein LOC127744815 isoform X2 n=1 Tax=Arachis duranensis TaxID=130453 RepID=A0A9C6TR07_ARADU|nr:uncharacterized protein LOC127744815 isoform X2 [Arachis duranensis]